MSRNPEFLKNVTLSFSFAKLIMPILICIITAILCIYSEHPYRKSFPREYLVGESITVWFFAIGFIYSIVIGTFVVVNSFAEEFKNKTWDFVRMSRISAMDLLMGKVFGASLSIWLCTLFFIIPCIAISVYLRIHTFNELLIQDYRQTILLLSLCLLGWIILSYTIAIASFLFGQLNSKVDNLATILLPLLMINGVLGVFINSPFQRLLEIYRKSQDYNASYHYKNIDLGDYYIITPNEVSWYGYKILPHNLLSAFIVALAGCSIVCCWRVLQSHLQVKQKPVFWIPFCIFWALFVSGFQYFENDFNSYGAPFNLYEGIFFLYLLSLAILVLEIGSKNKSYLSLQSIFRGDYRKFVASSPIFSKTAFLLIIFCILNLFIVKEMRSVLFSISTLGLLFRDFLATSLIANLKNNKFEVLLNYLYLIIFYFFFPVLLGMFDSNRIGAWKQNNLLLPLFPRYESNFTAFSLLLFIQIGLFAYILAVQKRNQME